MWNISGIKNFKWEINALTLGIGNGGVHIAHQFFKGRILRYAPSLCEKMIVNQYSKNKIKI